MKIALVFNPAAGSAFRLNRRKRLITQLTNLGHEVIYYPTVEPGDATRLVQDALDKGAETVVAFGGDGTVNEVIQAMAGSDVPLAVYPAGTTNVWCKQINMPINPRLAAQVISNGPRHMIDLGRVDDRYFLLMAGIGFDGEITFATDLELKKRLGKLAYVAAAFRLANFRGAEVTIKIDPTDGGEPVEVRTHTSLVVFANSERYATVRLARKARVDDGKLELMVFEGSKVLSKLARVVSVLTNRSEHDHKIMRYKVQSASIAAYPPVAAQIDGDPLGGRVGLDKAAKTVECIPAALRVIVPFTAPGYLFSKP